MRNKRAILQRTLRAARLIPFLLIPLAGCDDDLVSSCYDCSGIDGRHTEIVEQSFAVDDAALIEVDNFVGKVTYRIGERGIIRVRATKRARFRDDLERIEVDMIPRQGGLDIRTENLDDLKRVSVDLEITAPPSAKPQLITGVGAIDYQGRPKGVCRFVVGTGTITLKLHPDVGIMVDLNVGVGSILLHFPVDGLVRTASVKGRIGSGSEGVVYASNGVGSIRLVRWQ